VKKKRFLVQICVKRDAELRLITGHDDIAFSVLSSWLFKQRINRMKKLFGNSSKESPKIRDQLSRSVAGLIGVHILENTRKVVVVFRLAHTNSFRLIPA